MEPAVLKKRDDLLKAAETLRAELSRVRDRRVETPEPGWYTIDQLGEAMGRSSIGTLYRQINQLVRDGLYEKRLYRVQCGSLIRRVNHYRKVRTA